MRTACGLFCFAASLAAQTPDASAIMRRVSENLDRSESARTHYVYDQDVFIRLQRANGKLAREESRQYAVAPTEKGAARKLVILQGKILEGKKEVDYTEAGYRRKNIDIDGALVDSFAREVMWRHSAIPNMEWFPFERKDLNQYTFRLEGEERYRDYDVYRISFHMGVPEDQWEGEALIERNEYQPVLVTTAWTGHIPAAAKIAFGTNVQQIGAKISFKRFEKDVWFPVSCGGEMKLRVLFGYARIIAFSSNNSGFRKSDVQSSIEYDDM
ncbi:MAG TPA: hypothetical protein VK789_25805 [Bryobacteraceae bacterium]|jgi:hypothetical protein|nr:hypothetical protein [Bryobacteraceae bacterium]